MAQVLKIYELVITGSQQRSQRFTLGSAIGILIFVNESTLDSAVVTIEDPNDNIVINEAAMTKQANGIYGYVYQSNPNAQGIGDLFGPYDIIVKATKDGVTASAQTHVFLEEEG